MQYTHVPYNHQFMQLRSEAKAVFFHLSKENAVQFAQTALAVRELDQLPYATYNEFLRLVDVLEELVKEEAASLLF